MGGRTAERSSAEAQEENRNVHHDAGNLYCPRMRRPLVTLLVLVRIGGSVAAAAERVPAPEISLPDTEGKTVTLAEYRGRVVLLAFTRGAW